MILRKFIVLLSLTILPLVGSASDSSSAGFDYDNNMPVALTTEINTLLSNLINLSPISIPKVHLALSNSSYSTGYNFQKLEITFEYHNSPKEYGLSTGIAHEFGHHVFASALASRGVSRSDVVLYLGSIDELYADIYAVIFFGDPEAMVAATYELNRSFTAELLVDSCNDSHCALDEIRSEIWNSHIKTDLNNKQKLITKFTKIFIEVSLDILESKTSNSSADTIKTLRKHLQMQLN